MAMDEPPPRPQPETTKYRVKNSGIGTVIGDFNHVVQNFITDPHLGWYLLGIALLVVGSAAGLYFLLRPNAVNAKAMSGNFNIAVANFAAEGAVQPSDLGLNISSVVYSNLQSNLGDLTKSPYNVQLRGPDEIPRISGASEEERIAAAARIARSINADLVVYGKVTVNGRRYEIVPEFYINPARLPEDKEVTGPYEMGRPIVISGPEGPAFRAQLGGQVVERMQVLTVISYGLSYYATQDYANALSNFRTAEKMNWPAGMGREILYLLAGNAAGKSGQLDLALDYFTRALNENPQYARAYIGLGSVDYMRALLTFNHSQKAEDIDRALLAKSVKEYQAALSAADQPPGAEVPIKVHLGLGQCYVYQAYIGQLESFAPAAGEFQAVIQTYNTAPNPSIQELAGESYGHMGLIYRFQGENGQAITAYEQAVKLMDIVPERQQLYQSRIEELRGK